MKIAIFQNFMDNIGGAEKVGLTLARELKADIYTTNIDLEKIKKMGFKDVSIKSIGKIPKNYPLRQIWALKKFKKLSLKNKYDIYIICGEFALAGAIKNKPNLVYVHCLIKEAYENYDSIRNNFFHNSLGSKFNLKSMGIRTIFDLTSHYFRLITNKSLKHVDKIICNSQNTKIKIKKHLNRDSSVIYPPINCSSFKYKKNGDFWLSVNRLYLAKQIDIQIKAFQKMPHEKLIMVGNYENSKSFLRYKKHVEKIKSKNVKILDSISDKKLINLYANCKGFITTSKDEDFGMTPVEAMASGKPVIAPNEGGYKETVINGKTGVLIDNINTEKLVKAIKKVGKNPKKYKNACIKRAKKFDIKIFIKKIKQKIGI